MNQDYLWDKTGEDAEIERLENALQAFRYLETAPPALPAELTPINKKPPQKNYRVVYAVAACTAFVMLSVGAWLQISMNQTRLRTDLAKIVSPDNQPWRHDDLVMPDVPGETVNKVETSKEFPRSSNFKFRKTALVSARPNKPLIKNRRAARQTVVALTEEEKYAYDQLMLALAITSSKLKMVKDKVAGLEEPNTVHENQQ